MAFASGLPVDLRAALDAATALRANDFLGDIGLAWARGATGVAGAQSSSDSANPRSVPQPAEVAALVSLERSWEDCHATATGTLALFDDLAEQHRSVASLASALHDRCKELAELETKTRNVVAKVSKTLSVFDSYYVLASRLGIAVEDKEASAQALRLAEDAAAEAAATGVSLHGVSPRGPQLVPGHAEFAAALDRIDECIAHLAAHTGYKDVTVFLQRFRALQTAALQGVLRTVQVGCGSDCSELHLSLARIVMPQHPHRMQYPAQRLRLLLRCALPWPQSSGDTGCLPGGAGAAARICSGQRRCHQVLLPSRRVLEARWSPRWQLQAQDLQRASLPSTLWSSRSCTSGFAQSC